MKWRRVIVGTPKGRVLDGFAIVQAPEGSSRSPRVYEYSTCILYCMIETNTVGYHKQHLLFPSVFREKAHHRLKANLNKLAASIRTPVFLEKLFGLFTCQETRENLCQTRKQSVI